MSLPRAISLLLASWFVVGAGAASAAESRGLVALSYHDVVTTDAEALVDPRAVTVDNLVQQFAWLSAHGYHPIDLRTWRAATNGAELPPKPILLTFDDGYASFHEHVLPLLQLFDYPAVLAPVTGWIDTPANTPVDYAGESAPRERFLTWSQLADIARSGLVEVASHSHDLHRGVIGNSQGNLQPATVTRIFDPADGKYETETQYENRVREDLARSISLIEQHTGQPPVTMVWPYGRYTAWTNATARALGLDTVLILDDAPNPPGSRIIRRTLIGSDTKLFDFAMTVQNLYPDEPLRAAHVDLDDVYDPDPVQAERNLDALLDRIKAMGLSAVFLQAFADQNGDGVARSLYFRNRHLPVPAELFNRVAWQLRTRANVAVYAWMPVLAFELPDSEQNARLAVRTRDGAETERYQRLSPFHPEARQIIREIYQDLGRAGPFDGVLFHDDAYLADEEDVNPAALAHYLSEWQMDAQDPGLAERKSELVGEFIDILIDELRAFQPDLKTARSLSARLVTEPDSEAWFARNFADFIRRYDYAALIATPYLEQAADPEGWLKDVVTRVKRHPGAIARTLFTLQTVDWRSAEPLPAADISRQFELLMAAGAQHIAYYPDDFVTGHPPVQLVRSHLSVNDYPAIAE